MTQGTTKGVPIDTDGTLAANQDTLVASQKATKTYADTKIASTYLDTDGTLAANSDTKIASQKATKTYVDTEVAAIAWTYVKLASDFTTTANTQQSVTDFNFTPAADTQYEVEGKFLCQTSVTTVGARPGLTWPTGYDDGAARLFFPNNVSASSQRWLPAGTAGSANSSGATVADATYLGLFDATFIMGASPSGNFQITLHSETSGQTVRMMTGSYIRYRVIP